MAGNFILWNAGIFPGALMIWFLKYFTCKNSIPVKHNSSITMSSAHTC